MLALTAQHSWRTGPSWAVSFAPSPVLFVSYSGGHSGRDAVSARIAKGPLWLQPVWSATDHRLQADGLVQVGRVTVFASTRRSYVVTVRGPLDVQVARINGTTTGRVSLGPIPPSPFSPPIP